MNALELLDKISKVNNDSVENAITTASQLLTEVSDFMESDTITNDNPQFFELEKIFHTVGDGLTEIIMLLRSYSQI